MNIDLLKQKLNCSKLMHSSAAVLLLNDDIELNIHFEAAKDLYEIYKDREVHLSLKNSQHALQLHAATKELLQNIKLNMDSHIANIKTRRNGEHFFVIYVTDTDLLIGCLKVISQSGVTNERWLELWREPS
jgi:hypothetical protein